MCSVVRKAQSQVWAHHYRFNLLKAKTAKVAYDWEQIVEVINRDENKLTTANVERAKAQVLIDQEEAAAREKGPTPGAS